MRKRKFNFRQPKLMSARVENDVFIEFEKLIRYIDGRNLQEVMNMFVDEYVSGNLFLSGSKFCVKEQ